MIPACRAHKRKRCLRMTNQEHYFRFGYGGLRALLPSKYLTYSPLVFPLALPNQTVATSVTLTNRGDAPTTITELNFSGDGASAFASDQTLPLVIAAGQSATVGLTFAATDASSLFEANLEFVSDDVVHPVLTLPLSEIAIEGIVFRLSFDEPAGSSNPVDTSGNGFAAGLGLNSNPAPIFGRPPIAGRESTSVFINDNGGSGNYFSTANGFPNTPSFTYSLWVKPTAGAGDDTLFNRDGGFSQNDGLFGCTINQSGAVQFRIAGSEIVISEDGAVPDDEIRHVVVTHLDRTGFGDFIADRTRLYLDGKLVAENTETLEVPEYSGGTNSRLWIATRSAGGTGFNGEMDEFQLYNIELDERQVQQLFDIPNSVALNTPPTPLVITAIARNAGGTEVDLTFGSVPGLSYLLESSPDLDIWGEVVDGVVSQGEATTVTATGIAPEDSPLFFCVRVQK